MPATNLWSPARRSVGRPSGASDVRTPFEQDYDRLLFSTPVRRLADKTQVFPLERNDSVRTRLTHSHEVSNLAKSIGIRLIRTDPSVFGDDDTVRNAAPVILAATGLAHDLGNPPFGHQGEVAIAGWFVAHPDVFEVRVPGVTDVEMRPEHRTDFTKFEGNAQALRLVSRLQNTSGPSGLNLTAATLAAMIKYPVSSSCTSDVHPATKKHGFVTSELDVVEWIRKETGLEPGQRHPLTWIMECADDIAYSVLDIEDAIKKGLVSAEDLLAYLRGKFKVSDLGGLTNQLAEDFAKADGQEFSLSRVREIKTTYVRTRLVERLVSGATTTYLAKKADFLRCEGDRSLLDCGTAESTLCTALKDFAKVHAYQSTTVLQQELKGAIVVSTLMDRMWGAITSRKDFQEPASRRTSATAAYIYSLISDSYRWHFERNANSELPMRYRELQLLTDMIAGMTDGYAVDLFNRIESDVR